MNEQYEKENLVVLTDENGKPAVYEWLDSIEYQGEDYEAFLPQDDSDDAAEVVILKVDYTGSEEEASYVSVDDEETLQAVFEIFKDRFEDEFNFVD